MRAIPPEILAWLQPDSERIVESRPWWRRDAALIGLKDTGFIGLVRNDGERIARSRAWGVDGWWFRGGWPLADQERGVVARGDYETSEEAAILRLDRARPARHPGIRPGQIWALEHSAPAGSFVVCGTLACADGAWSLGEPVLLSQLEGREEGVVPYLLHDPLMPSRAPWAPPEVPDAG